MEGLDANLMAAKVIEILGGRDKAWALIDREYGDMTERWNTDVAAIGRILRAHLYVEYYLTNHLQHANPNLGDLGEARLSFDMKIKFLKANNPPISELKPGLKKLNTIRNGLAHRLNASIRPEDAAAFLSVELFSVMRQESARHEGKVLSFDPLEILEEFSLFASSLLHATYSAHGQAVQKAIAEQLQKAG